jgi:MFS family permease
LSKQAGISRLSALMFFQLFVFGSFGPILSMYLQHTLHFSSRQAGFIMALSVVSSIVAPLLSVYVVDRLIQAKWLFILCHGILAASAAGLFMARSFEAFLILFLINALCTGPSMGMLNAITFQQLHDLEGNARNYGSVRVWGTVGWMGAGYLVSGLWAILPSIFPGQNPAGFQASAFIIASAGSILCIVLAIGLPKGARAADSKREFIPRAALDVIKRKGVAVLAVVYLISSIIDKLYSFGAAPYLSRSGFNEAWIPWLGLVGISLNGLVFACLYSAILMYIDYHSDAQSRQSLHQLVQLFLGGTSTLIGNLLAGRLGQLVQAGGGTGYRGFWLYSLAGALASALLVWLLFSEEKTAIRRKA